MLGQLLGKPWQWRFRRAMVNLITLTLIISAGTGVLGFGLAPSAWADVPSNEGATLFETHCAGCHPSGGNIIKRGKTLKLKPLTRRHLDSVEAIATFVTQGKGLMSAYGEILTPEDISTVSTYVWDQAQTNWKP